MGLRIQNEFSPTLLCLYNPKISNESKNEISEIVKQPNIQPHPECVQP